MKLLLPFLSLILLSSCITIESYSGTSVRFKREATFRGDFTASAELDQQPKILKQKEPRLPNRRNRNYPLNGSAIVRLLVNEQGNPEQIQCVQATNFDFAVSAERCVSGWKFEPGMQNGQKVKSTFEVELSFDTQMNKTRKMKTPKFRDPQRYPPFFRR